MGASWQDVGRGGFASGSVDGPVAAELRPVAVASVDGAVVAVAMVYEQEQRACPQAPASAEDACIAAVRARWGLARASLMTAADAVRAAMGQP